jgi:hypothetical protein
MHVRVLETWWYHPDGRRRPPVKLIAPTWEEIETAIRRLDRRTSPILFLWASDDPARQTTDELSERLEILGGDGLYWLAGTFGGYFQRRFLDLSSGDEQIEVYGPEIEQGFGDASRYICRNVHLVLRAACFYAERGGFDPSVSWEEGYRFTKN